LEKRRAFDNEAIRKSPSKGIAFLENHEIVYTSSGHHRQEVVKRARASAKAMAKEDYMDFISHPCDKEAEMAYKCQMKQFAAIAEDEFPLG
jgi:hypothetical protein